MADQSAFIADRRVFIGCLSVFIFLLHSSAATRSSRSYERPSLSPTGDLIPWMRRQSFRITVCERQTKTLRCTSSNHVIFVEDAFYGRSDRTTCPASRYSMSDTDCRSDKAFYETWKRCQGQRYCRLSASNSIYGDPCRGTVKYLIMQYRCSSPDSDTIGFCLPNSWGSWINIDRPSGNGDFEVLADHKRRSRDACESPIGMQIRLASGGSFTRGRDAVRNSLAYGASCTNRDQSDRSCNDYKVRYCCLQFGPVPAPASCSLPRLTYNLQVTPQRQSTFTTGQSVVYSCRTGYRLQGEARVTCTSHGWSSAAPTCTATVSRCTSPKAPEHGSMYPIRSTWNANERVTFSCNRGFFMQGNSISICLQSGSWSHAPPTCLPQTTSDCGGVITGRQSGQITSPNFPRNYPDDKECIWLIKANEGQTIEFTIAELDLEPNRRCRYDYLEFYNGTTRYNTRVQKVCGFLKNRVYRSNTPSVTLRFRSDGSDNRKGFLINWRVVGTGGTRCPSPASPSYGSFSPSKSSWQPGDYVTYRCAPGYALKGVSRQLCTQSGAWSHSPPTCVRSVSPSSKRCYAVGDPHYGTFDGKRYDFQGTCSYVLVKTLSQRRRTRSYDFVVEVDNEHRGRNKRVSWLRKVYVRLSGLVIEMLKGRVIKFTANKKGCRVQSGRVTFHQTVDGVEENLPFNHAPSGLNIRASGRFVVLKTSFGLKVVYDGRSYLTVELPASFRYQVEGLCGDNNGNPDDDFRQKGTHNIFTDPNDFAAQFQTRTKRCTAERPKDVSCSGNKRSSYTKRCSILSKSDGCFANCHSLVNPQSFVQDCVFDACAYDDITSAIDANVGAYAQICREKKVQICSTWRNDTKTELICPPNSHYSSCMSACPRTCSDSRGLVCQESCVEGCDCNEGFVLSGTECVPRSQCGCTHESKYYKNGQTFYSRRCSKKCTCRQGRTSCTSTRCQSGERCGKDKQGRAACVPSGFGICKAWGDPHYMTLDGSGWFDFMGTCTYVMARTHRLHQSDPRWFSVMATNEHRGRNKRVSYLQSITINLRGGEDVIKLEKNRVIRVNGEVVKSFSSEIYSVKPSGRSVVFTTPHRLLIFFNGNGVRIKIPNTYRGKINGICGNFNGRKQDDLEMQSGQQASNFSEFAQSYIVGQCGKKLPEPFVCSDAEKRRWSGAQYCGALTTRGGVFQSCQRVVNAKKFFEKCVFDLCATNGDLTILTQALETYVAECQAHDIEICSWRDRTGAQNMSCSRNSHYNGCASPCPDTCASPYASTNCHIPGQVEDCICNVGYVRDGDECIRRSECGCTIDGAYVSRGSRYTSQNRECACSGQNRYECSCVQGYQGNPCRDVDECLRNPCDVNALCTNSLGSYTCECNDGYNGDGVTCAADAQCKSPDAIDNGSFSPRSSDPRPVGSVVRYKCNRGYATVGDVLIRCQESGKWSAGAPRCEDVNECGQTPSVCNEFASCSNTDGSYTCVCNEGYTGNGQSCTAVTCSSLSDPVYGSRSPAIGGRYDAGATVTFSCNTGFQLDGQSSLTCLNTGHWSSAPPSCFDINECSDRSNDCNENANCTNTVGSFTCSCKRGYTGNGRTCTALRCSLPRLPRRGAIEPSDKTSFAQGETIRYVCNPGYAIKGSEESTCGASGVWSSAPPTCVDVDECSLKTDTCHQNAVCTNTIGSFTCRCSAGYTGDGESCSVVNCPSRTAPANGQMTPSSPGSFQAGLTLIFECNAGYSLEGSESITCLASGLWTSLPPTCTDIDECASSNPCHKDAICRNTLGQHQCRCKAGYQGDGVFCSPITCEFPGKPSNTIIARGEKSRYRPGSSLLYACNVGYTLIGQAVITCENTGQWTAFPPRCSDIDECSDDLNPCHSQARCDNVLGSYDCTCNQGFRGNGKDCEEITCAELPVPGNVIISLVQTSYSVGTNVTFSCQSGYALQGAATSRCQSDGTWSETSVSCVDIQECANRLDTPCDQNAECANTVGSFTCSCNSGYTGNGLTCELIQCPIPVPPINGYFSPPSQTSWAVGDAVTYGCNKGYTRNGASSATCLDSGEWSESAPTCTDIDECANNIAVCDVNAECENTDGSFRCTCQEGYVGNGLNCSRIQCPALSDVKNSVRNPRADRDFYFGDTVSYTCITGYTRAGFARLTCLGSGTWSASEPSCDDIDECQRKEPCSVSATCTNTPGSYTCECNDGYTGTGIICNRITCRRPFPDVNGIFTPDNLAQYVVTTNVTYSCNAGYALVGEENTATCQQNGRWSMEEPSCTDIDECTNSPALCGEGTTCSNTDGSYRCTCQSGYTGDGMTCNKIACSDLGEIVNGSLISSAQSPYTVGDVVTYTCDTGFALFGNSRVECMLNGLWSNEPPSCFDINECRDNTHECDVNARCENTDGSYDCICDRRYSGDGRTCTEIQCSEPVIPANGFLSTQSQAKYTLGSRIVFACNAGYTLQGSATATCQGDGQWSAAVPTCVDVDECQTIAPCSSFASCDNTPGSYTCICFEGYLGDGVQCKQITCPAPSPSANVVMTSSSEPPYVYGNSVLYSCSTGFTLSGTASATCLISGQWSNPEPNCVDIDECENSSCDENALCVNTPGSFTCFCNNKYTGDGFSCRLIECPRPDRPALTTITPVTQQTWGVGSTARYSCPVGYSVVGSRILSCLETGLWSVKAPTCQDDNECENSFGSPCDSAANCTNTEGSFECQCMEGYRGEGRLCSPVMCERPASIDSGTFVLIDGSTMMGSSVLYKCKKGYNLVGQASATCLNSGVWSEVPPSCSEINECSTDPCDVNADCVDLIGGYRCNCREGYTGSGEVCQRIECRQPRPITFGRIEPAPAPGSKYYFNDEVRYFCDSGYSLIGSSRAVCQLDGTYSAPTPRCDDIDECENSPNKPCHRNATCDNVPGSYVCSCKRGFSGDGKTCTVRTCNDLSVPNNGRIVNPQNVWSVNDEAEFACSTGYRIVGRRVLTCLHTGLWSSKQPTCSDIDECLETTTCDSHATCTNTLGSFSCACDSGYEGDGFTCTEISCPKLNSIPHGQLHPVSKVYNVNIRVTYRCNSGYTLQGSNQLICTDTGSWSASEPVCVDDDECLSAKSPCDSNALCENSAGSFTCTCNDGYSGDGILCQEVQCSKPDSVKHATLDDVRVTYSVGSVVTYTCANGYRISGTAQLTCQSSGLWSVNEPMCVDIDECGEGICDTNADCTNLPGGYQCTCSIGFAGDGRNCNGITCAAPDVPQGVSIIDGKQTYSFGETVRFKCSKGFALIGPSSVTCTETGGYSDRIPRCADVDECRDNPCDANASCDNAKGTFNCTCNKGYSGDGRTCNRVVCRDVTTPVNGEIITVVKQQFVEDDRVVFRCSRGYSLVGSISITCGSEGTWSDNEPTCTDVNECADDTLNACHQHAACTNTDGSYNCTCNQGYSGNGYICNQIRCSILRAPANGRITASRARPPYVPSDVITYSCLTGYALSGAAELNCLADGSWSSTPPTCADINECVEPSPCDPKADCTNTLGGFLCTCGQDYAGDGLNCQKITCRDVSAPRHGSMLSKASPPFAVNDVIDFSCDGGYSLSGVSSIKCLLTGFWSALPPTCTDVNECRDEANPPCSKDATCENTEGGYTCTCNNRYSGDGISCTLIECPAPTIIAPASTVPGRRDRWVVDDKIRYLCPTGYRLVGSSVITCLDTGRWSPNPPSCADVDECSDSSLNFCGTEATCVNNPGSYTCTCNDGYVGDGFICSAVHCKRPSKIDFGTVVLVGGSTVMGSSRMYTCNSGFSLVGVASSTCLNSGVWSDSPPTCVDVDECNRQDKPCHSNANCVNSPGSYECTCQSGYSGNGEFCSKRECPSLVAPDNGALQPAAKRRWVFGDEARFSCDSSFTLVGDEALTCLQTGVWSNSPATCEDVDECADPSNSPCHSSAVCDNTVGSYLCTCLSGFTGNGTTCTELVCDAIAAPQNGFRSSDEEEFSPGESVTFSCKTGYQIQGRVKLTCLSGGTWSGRAPTCVDTNECTTSAPCNEYATCTNTEGSYTCACNRDFVGDGISCTKITCSALNGIANGAFRPNLGDRQYSVDSVVRYSCIRGYKLQGQAVRTCVNQNNAGLWSSAEPSCVDINECADDPSPCDTNAQCANSPGSYSCTCNEGFAGSGIFCEAIQCRRPDAVRHATMSPRKVNYAVDEKVTYTCADGYQMSGEAVLTCQASQTWSPSVPSCSDINECSDPSLNSCDQNASCLNEPGSYTCTCNERYSGDGFSCVLITCVTPSLSQSLSIVGGARDVYTVGDVITYACDKGFTLQGSKTIECLNSGVWSGLQARCTDVDECRDNPCGANAACANQRGTFTCICNRGYRKESNACIRTTCPVLSAPTNGRIATVVKEQYYVDDIISFQCQRSYEISGSRVLTCREDGTWSASAPQCQDFDECADKMMSPCHAQANCSNIAGGFICTCNEGFAGNGFFCSEIQCPTLSSPVHGSISSSKTGPYLPNDVVTYACDDGYMLTSNGQLTCESGGSWSDNPPTCKDINECQDVNPCHENATCTNSRGSYSCQCKIGFSGDGVNCEVITCAELPEFVDGSVTHIAVTGNVLGTAVRYQCNPGYFLVGSATTTCTQSGQWSHEPPSCVDINECAGSPLSRCSFKAECQNTVGSFVCTCEEGYKGDGRICEKKRCTSPTIPPNGRVVGGVIFSHYDVGKTVSFLCAPGYQLEGAATVTCTSDETWSHAEPTCTDFDECADPANSPCGPNASCNNAVGTFTCTCNSGYRSIGKTCELITCQDISAPSRGSLTSESTSPYVIGDVLKFTCDNGFALRGASTLTCRDTGLWSHIAPVCVDINECAESGRCDSNAFCQNLIGSYACTCFDRYTGNGTTCTLVDCGNPGEVDNGRIILRPIGDFVKGSQVQYKCNSGFTLVGSDTITCSAAGTWSNAKPTCRDIDECQDKAAPPCDVNASCQNTVGSFTCACNDGYTGNGRFCQKTTCSRRLNRPRYGSITLSNRNVAGSEASFSCNNGFVLRGEGTIVCQNDGTWSANEPVCQDVNECATGANRCDPNAACQNAVGTYHCTCRAGYEGNGFSCTETVCILQPAGLNVALVTEKNRYVTGDVAEYRCAAGYSLVGSRTTECLETGRWSEFPPTCVDIDECADSPCDENASCTNSKGTFVCTCNNGYSGNGTSCFKVECPTLRTPDNGAVSSFFKTSLGVGNTITYRCNPGYSLVGRNRLTCQESGQWSHPVPTCSDVDECTDSTLNNCHRNAGCTNTDGSYECACNEGYTGDGIFCSPRRCLTPKVPDNGFVQGNFIYSHYDQGSTVTFLCRSGYQISGNQNITCMSTGLWSTEEPSCVDINECSDPNNTPCDDSADCENVAGSYRCSCRTGYRGNGRKCTLISCRTINAPSNGQITAGQKEQYVVGNTLSFICNNGFAIRGSSILTCQESGFWDVQPPICLDVNECTESSPCDSNAFCQNTNGGYTCTCLDLYSGDGLTCTLIDCGDPGTITNGRITLRPIGRFVKGSRVQYKCNSGYRLLGNGTLTCLASGTWSSPLPTCEDKNECSDPLNSLCDANAECINTVGGYECRCNSGYVNVGGVCEEIQCRPLRKPSKVTLTLSNGRFVGSEATFTCAAGYVISGDGTLVCESQGRWSGTEPSCSDVDECTNPTERCGDNARCLNTIGSYSCFCNIGYRSVRNVCTRVTCETRTAPDNGRIVDAKETYFATNRIVYECSSGYTLIGHSVAFCLQQGSWSHQPPTCQDINECGMEFNSACAKEATCTNLPGSFTCTCNEGYVGSGSFCEKRSCVERTSIRNGRVTSSSSVPHLVGDVITYSCDSGYVLQGSNTSTCGSDGVWSSQPPSCDDVNECSSPDTCAENARCENSVGSYECTCNFGYTGNGKTCEAVQCDRLRAPSRGLISPAIPVGQKYNTGTTVSFDCEKGFSLVGAASLTCLRTGLWSAPVPTCADIDECLDHASAPCPSHSTCSNTVGSFTCKCDTGYVEEGAYCRRAVCVAADNIPRASYSPIKDEYVFSDSITYSCQSGYVISGTAVLTCQVNGQWDHSSPSCVDVDECMQNLCNSQATCTNSIGSYSCQCNRGYTGNGFTCTAVDCGQPASISNGYSSPSTLSVWPVGIDVVYNCNPGYKIVGSKVLSCRDNGVPSGDPPSCVDLDECAKSTDNDCSEHATCTNTVGSYRCECNEGYTGNGRYCERLACSRPLSPQGGTYVPREPQRYAAEAEITYQCHSGYRVSGPANASCHSNGSWVPPSPPLCDDIDECAEGIVECHANAQCVNVPGTAECRCREGYTGDGRSCRQVTCQPPANPDRGGYSPQGASRYTFGQSITYHCRTGFEIVGETTAVCQGNGAWSLPSVVCTDVNECREGGNNNCDIRAICQNTYGSHTCQCVPPYTGDGRTCRQATCPNPIPIHRGTYQPTKTRWVPNDEITYSCQTGYVLVGTATVTCASNGQWSNQPPRCMDVNECLNSNPCHRLANCINSDGSYRCECQHGHFGDGTSCTLVMCPEPNAPANGNVSPRNQFQYRLSTVISYYCNSGYSITGHAQATCTDSQEWSNPTPTCNDINECQLDKPPCDENAICANTVGSYKCTCREGYLGDGRHCRVPVCQPPGTPTGGSFTTSDDSYPVGTVVTFACSTGYVLRGNSRIECTSGPVWSGNPPLCSDIDECATGTITCQENAECVNTQGSYKCGCSRGYTAGNDQQCVLVTCDNPPSVDKGSFTPAVQNVWKFGDTVTYNCRDGFTLEGSRTSTCGQNGQWSSQAPLCRRVRGDAKYCTVSGDPHYDTFDGHHYDYQGACLYDLVSTTPSAETNGLTQFSIETQNENRFGLTHVTWLQSVTFKTGGKTIQLRKQLVVMVDGVATNLPYSDTNTGISVRRSGRYITVDTGFGLYMRYDGDHYFTVGLPPSYQNYVQGLCGNYNGIASDDMQLKGSGENATDNVAFGNSYQINSPSDCAVATASGDVCTSPAKRAQFAARCEMIRATGGCFNACHAYVNPNKYYQDCIFDLCAFNGDQQAVTLNVGAYAAQCQGQGVTVCAWRTQIGATLQCPAHSTYKLCTSACPNTCVDKQASQSCSQTCVEGCECNEGYLLSGNECVPAGECGCQNEGKYYKNGQTFYTSRCLKRCTCVNGDTQCSTAGCPSGQRCAPDDNGSLGCQLPTASCDAQPIPKMIRLPSSCSNPDSSVRFVDVGACPSVKCPRSNSFVTPCCGAVDRRLEEVQCHDGSTIRVSKVTRCGCSQCTHQTITVTGKVFGLADDGSQIPLRFGFVVRNNRSAATTDNEGQFSVSVDPDVDRLVLTFIDNNNKLMTTTKVIPFKKLGGDIFHFIRVPRKANSTSSSSQDRGNFSPTSSSGQSSVITIEIEPNSYFLKNGISYHGDVTRSITYIDPRDVSSYMDAPGDLLTQDGRAMRSYGMFDMDFRNSANRELDVRNIRVSMLADQIGLSTDRQQARLWSLDPVTGLWKDEGGMSVTSSSRGLVVTGNIPLVRSRRLLNVDVASSDTCFVKVRAFGSDDFNVWDQVSYVLVTAVVSESSGSQWRTYGSALTRPETGACLRLFCDVAQSGTYTATFSATLNAKESLDAAASNPQDSTVIGISSDALQLLDYWRGDHASRHGSKTSFTITLPQKNDATHLRGPFYSDEFDCIKAPNNDSHFRFSRTSSANFEFNTIPIDENNIFFTWQNNPLIWWPNPTQFQACYMKVKFIHPTPVSVQSKCTVGTRPGYLGQLYGIRETTSVSNGRESTACIEFKCSSVSLDGQSDRSLVAITPTTSTCRRHAVNQQLRAYLETRLPLAGQINQVSYRMYAPPDPLGQTYGVYKNSASDPVTAKRFARGHCFAGESRVMSDTMKIDNNVAVTFKC